MKKITVKIFMKQLLIKDLFGKDSYKGISLTYAWLANQLGHISLGFIPVTFLSVFYNQLKTPVEFSLFVFTFWFTFEVINLIFPLLLSKTSNVFKPEWDNLVFDTVTDILYFSLGAFGAGYLFSLNKRLLAVVILNFIVLIYPFIYWYTCRIYQQYAYFPCQFRLAQWNGYVDQSGKEIIKQFVNTKYACNKNLLILGNANEYKTSLGVAIANELAIKKQKCTYTTVSKLYNMFYKTIDNNDRLWNWKDCKYLIIDDINTDSLKHQDFLKSLNKFVGNNIDVLKTKHIIWIVRGDVNNIKKEWSTILDILGRNKKSLISINVGYQL